MSPIHPGHSHHPGSISPTETPSPADPGQPDDQAIITQWNELLQDYEKAMEQKREAEEKRDDDLAHFKLIELEEADTNYDSANESLGILESRIIRLATNHPFIQNLENFKEIADKLHHHF